MSYIFGLDLGQAQDYTALSILHKTRVSGEVQYHARHAERFALGTTYPDMIDRVEARLTAVNLSSPIVADATGVGRPVVDLMRARKLRTIPVTITGGEKELFDPDMGGWRVPKRILVSNLQVLLQDGKLKFADGMMHAQTLINELMAFKVKINANANDTYEAWREGDHDDLVLALALAAWYAVRYVSADDDERVVSNIPNPWLKLQEIL